jgi:hypothetical protein
MVYSCSFIVLCSLAALPAQDTIRGAASANPFSLDLAVQFNRVVSAD